MTTATLLICALDGLRFGAPVLDVLDIAPPPETRPIPGAAPGVVGLAPAFGDIALIVDLRAAIGLPATDAPGREAVYLRHDQTLYGFIFDAVGESVSAPDDARIPLAASGFDGRTAFLCERAYRLADGVAFATNGARLVQALDTPSEAARTSRSAQAGIQCGHLSGGAR